MGFHKVLNGPPARALSPVIPNNARPLRLTAAAGTELAETSSGIDQTCRSRRFSTLTAVYTPKGFILHAALLHQTFVHCGIFVAAATRRCPGSVSVPMRRVNLSIPLPVVGLVGRYPANYLIGHGPIPDQRTFGNPAMRPKNIIRFYPPFREAIPESGVRYPCITRQFATKRPSRLLQKNIPFDLHALAMPPAFVLSQDQTLRRRVW